MTSFKLAFHTKTTQTIVEVYDDDGRFVGAIYPTTDHSNRIHIVSRYFSEPVMEASLGAVPLPGYTIKFRKPSP